MSFSYLDLHLEIDSEDRLRTKLYEKIDHFNFPIVNFPFMCSNILAAPAHGVYASQLIRYSTACGFYNDFHNRCFLLVKLKSSFRKFYGRCHHLVTQSLCHKWPWIFSIYCSHNPILSSFMTYHRDCKKSNTTDATCGVWTVYPSGAPDFIPNFSGVRVARSIVFCAMFCR